MMLLLNLSINNSFKGVETSLNIFKDWHWFDFHHFFALIIGVQVNILKTGKSVGILVHIVINTLTLL